MLDAGVYVTIQDDSDSDFQEVLSRSSSKGKKSFLRKENYSPPQDPTPPSQNLGIYLKISPDILFEIKKIPLLRVAILKLLKCSL